MKAKDKKEINTKNIKELKTMLKEAKDKLFSLNIEKSQKELGKILTIEDGLNDIKEEIIWKKQQYF